MDFYSRLASQLRAFQQLATDQQPLTEKQETEFSRLADDLRRAGISTYDLPDLIDPANTAILDLTFNILLVLAKKDSTETAVVNVPDSQLITSAVQTRATAGHSPTSAATSLTDIIARQKETYNFHLKLLENRRLRLLRESLYRASSIPTEPIDKSVDAASQSVFPASTSATAEIKTTTPYNDLADQQSENIKTIRDKFALDPTTTNILAANFIEQQFDADSPAELLLAVAAAKIIAQDLPTASLAEESIPPAYFADASQPVSSVNHLLSLAGLDPQTATLTAQEVHGVIKNQSNTVKLQTALAIPTTPEPAPPLPLIANRLTEIVTSAPATGRLVSTGAPGLMRVLNQSPHGQQALKENGVKNFNTLEYYETALQKHVRQAHLDQLRQERGQSNSNGFRELQNSYNQFQGMYSQAKGVIQQFGPTRRIYNAVQDGIGHRLGLDVLSGKAKQVVLDSATKMLGKAIGEKAATEAIKKAAVLAAGELAKKATAFVATKIGAFLASLGIEAVTGPVGWIIAALQLAWEAIKFIAGAFKNLLKSLLPEGLGEFVDAAFDWKTWAGAAAAGVLGAAGALSAFTAGIIGAITFTFLSPVIFAVIIGAVVFFWIPTINIAPLLSTIVHLDSGLGNTQQNVAVAGGICWPVDGVITQLDSVDSPNHKMFHSIDSGLDIGGDNALPVYAPFTGSYVFHPDDGGEAGNYIVGTSSTGLTTYLLHLAGATFAPASSISMIKFSSSNMESDITPM